MENAEIHASVAKKSEPFIGFSDGFISESFPNDKPARENILWLVYSRSGRGSAGYIDDALDAVIWGLCCSLTGGIWMGEGMACRRIRDDSS